MRNKSFNWPELRTRVFVFLKCTKQKKPSDNNFLDMFIGRKQITSLLLH